MKKGGIIIIAILIGTILYEILIPAISPGWPPLLRFLIECGVIIVSGYIGSTIATSINHQEIK